MIISKENGFKQSLAWPARHSSWLEYGKAHQCDFHFYSKNSIMKNISNLQDFNIHVKFKLSALWIATMFCYVYGDFFTLFVPGRIENLMSGNSGVGSTSPIKLLLFAMLMTIPSVMIFLSLALKANVNRWMSLIIGTLFTLIMILVVSTSLGEWMIFYTYLGVVEIILTSLVVWFAWRWPKE